MLWCHLNCAFGDVYGFLRYTWGVSWSIEFYTVNIALTSCHLGRGYCELIHLYRELNILSSVHSCCQRRCLNATTAFSFLSHDAVAVAFSIQTVLASEYLTAEINAKITAAFTFFWVGSFFFIKEQFLYKWKPNKQLFKSRGALTT